MPQISRISCPKILEINIFQTILNYQNNIFLIYSWTQKYENNRLLYNKQPILVEINVKISTQKLIWLALVVCKQVSLRKTGYFEILHFADLNFYLLILKAFGRYQSTYLYWMSECILLFFADVFLDVCNVIFLKNNIMNRV